MPAICCRKMGFNIAEFETFEKELLKLIEELQTVSSSEARLREALRAEATRAEAAEAARDGAERASRESRAAAAAACAAAAQTNLMLAKAQDEVAATKMQLELTERHRATLEEKCVEMATDIEILKRELQKLKPLETSYASLHRQYIELQERIHVATNDSRREATRLEAELRRVEQCAAAGAEIRERARLAAAAHVRERRLAAAEIQHTNHELHTAKAESTKLSALVAELQYRITILSSSDGSISNTGVNFNEEALRETRAALEAERAGTARLERALVSALADNAALAAKLNSTDNSIPTDQAEPGLEHAQPASTSICAIDSFLAE